MTQLVDSCACFVREEPLVYPFDGILEWLGE